MMSQWIQRSTYVSIITAAALVLLLIPSDTVQAQSTTGVSMGGAPEWTYGIRVGANFSGVSGDNIAVEEPGLQPTIGAFLTYALTDWLAVQPEVNYRPHEVGLSSTQRSPAQTWQYTTHYIGVPVLLKWYLPSPGTSRIHVLAGPDVAFKLDENVDLTTSQTAEFAPAFGDAFNSTDVGAIVGGGIDRFVAGRLFSLDVRYEIGMTDLVTQSNGPSLYDRTFNITVGIGL